MSNPLTSWIKRFRRSFANPARRGQPAAVRGRTRRSLPGLEVLEDRLAPATFTVNSLADLSIQAGVNPVTGAIVGQGHTVTLRSAIAAANMTPGGNTINLMFPGTYTIALPGANTGTDASGAFAILPGGGNLTIVNHSDGAVTVDGNHLDRVFDINPTFNFAAPTATAPFTVTLQGFTITNGVASPGDGAAGSGGGIRDQGNASLTLNNVVVTNNLATADGGGICMENIVSEPWKLTVNNSVISNNHAGDAGGGIETDGTGKVFINTGTVITGNTCVNQGAGIWLDDINPDNAVTSVTISNPGTFKYFFGPPGVTFTSVDGKGSGARGIAVVDPTTHQVTGVTITNPGSGYDLPPTISFSYAARFKPNIIAVANLTPLPGPLQSATLTVTGAILSNNDALTGPGGGIGNAGSGAVTLTGSTIENNFSGAAGGGFADQNNQGSLTVLTSLFLNNVAVGTGGGIQEGGPSTIITSSQIQGNASGNSGGAIFADGSTLTVTQSTIAFNTASGDGNGLGGGGIELETTGTSSITDTTITGNRALNNAGANGGGIDATNLAGSVTLLNDTINANFATNGGGVFWGGKSGSFFNLQNTILAQDFIAAGGTGVDADGPGGPFFDLGGNLIGVAGDANSGFTSRLSATTQTGTLAHPLNPVLGPLGNNGGPVIGAPGASLVLQTEALETGSLAIGHGIRSMAPGFDERGFPTLVNGILNVGAVSTVVPLPRLMTQVNTRLPLVSQKMVNGVLTTTFNVNSTADTHTPPAGTLTLRAAIDMANSTKGNKVIQLLVPGDYQITLPGANTGTNASGAFAILPSGGNVTILNASGGTVTVDGNHLDRVFDINPGDDTKVGDAFSVTLQGLTITNGIASPGDGAAGSGGGIRDQGIASLVLTNDVVTNNLATADGGGVSMENTVSAPWTLTVNNSVISNNHAGDAGGGIETDGTGKVFINTGTVITGNTCVNQGAGVWLDDIQVDNVFQGATLNVTGVLISNNAALDMLGGGIGNAGNGAVTITGSTIENNFSGGTGGGFADSDNQGTLTVLNSLFLNNVAVGNGGGIQEGGPSTTITNSEIAGNSSGGAGGGLFANGATLTVLNCTFANNTASGDGKGLGGGGMEVQTTGGFFATTITNTTITGNRALNSAGANGGGIDTTNVMSGVFTVNDTINANFASSGGGVYWAPIPETGGWLLQNTILAQNFIANGGSGVDAVNLLGQFTADRSLIGVAGDANALLGSNLTGTLAHPLDPLLGPLGNNGGPMIGAPGTMIVLQTEALKKGSPALGEGDKGGAPLTDERGVKNGKVITIGAVNA